MKENVPNWNKQLCCQSPQFFAVSNCEWPVYSSKKGGRVTSCVPSRVVWLCICDEVKQDQSNCSWMTLPWLCECLRMSVPSSQGCRHLFMFEALSFKLSVPFPPRPPPIHIQYCDIMKFTVLHNRHHKVSQSVPFFMYCETVTISLWIGVRGHFVMSITNNHESHYVTVLNNPPPQSSPAKKKPNKKKRKKFMVLGL